jgi:hypothetical protein
MLGRAAVAMWWEIWPEMKAEFEDWHSHEHMPERLRIPGFLRGTRWIAQSGGPSYFVLYEVAELATITSGPYLERLNDPTPWSRKMMPHHRNMVRSLCRIRASFGGGLPHALATVRLSPAARRGGPLRKWIIGAIGVLPQRKGLTGAQLLESQPMPGAPTAEQQIRGGDAKADWVVLVSGYDAEAVKAVLDNQLSADALVAQGASLAVTRGLFRSAYSLISKEPRPGR